MYTTEGQMTLDLKQNQEKGLLYVFMVPLGYAVIARPTWWNRGYLCFQLWGIKTASKEGESLE